MIRLLVSHTLSPSKSSHTASLYVHPAKANSKHSMAKFLVNLVLVATSLLVGNVLAIQIWPSPGAIPTTVPAACRAALVQNLTCSDYLMTAQKAADGEALVGDLAKSYCTNDWYSSLQTFQTNTKSRCGDTLYTLYPNTTVQQSVTLLSDGLVWAYNLTCIQDS